MSWPGIGDLDSGQFWVLALWLWTVSHVLQTTSSSSIKSLPHLVEGAEMMAVKQQVRAVLTLIAIYDG